MTLSLIARHTRSPGMAAVAAAVLLTATPSLAAAPEVVARLGARDVTLAEVSAYLDTLRPEDRAALGRDPALLTQAVRAYLGRQAVLAEARARHLDDEPGVKARLDRIRDEALIELYLEQVSRPPEGYPSEQEAKAAYEANLRAFEVPRQWRVAQIFFAAPRGDAEADKKSARRMEEARERLRKGTDFATVAAAGDQEGASASGGEIGWLSEAQLLPGIRATVTALTKGAVSEPIQLDDGWHLLKVLDTRPATTRPFAEVRGAIVDELRAARAQASRRAHLAKLLEKNAPIVNELALSKLGQPR